MIREPENPARQTVMFDPRGQGGSHDRQPWMENGIPGPVGPGFFCWRCLARENRPRCSCRASQPSAAGGCSGSRRSPSPRRPGAAAANRLAGAEPDRDVVRARCRRSGCGCYALLCASARGRRDLPKVGGHLDPNFEAIVALEPDLVVLIPSGEANGDRLESLGPLGARDRPARRRVAAGVHFDPGRERAVSTRRGTSSATDLERRLAAVPPMVGGAPRPRTVVVVGHDIGGGMVRSVWTAGPDTFYDGVLEIAGGVNAVEGGLVRYPELSREGLAALDPDVVLDVVAGVEERGAEIDEILAGLAAADRASSGSRGPGAGSRGRSDGRARATAARDGAGGRAGRCTRSSIGRRSEPSRRFSLTVSASDFGEAEILREIDLRGRPWRVRGRHRAQRSGEVHSAALPRRHRRTDRRPDRDLRTSTSRVQPARPRSDRQLCAAARCADRSNYTVRSFVEMGRYPPPDGVGCAHRDRSAAVIEAMHLTGVTEFADRSMASLSGGERQRASIAAALAQGGSILLLDEPTSFLDYRHQVQILDLLDRLHSEKGLTVVAVTHDLNSTVASADSVLALKNGRVERVGPPVDLLDERGAGGYLRC